MRRRLVLVFGIAVGAIALAAALLVPRFAGPRTESVDDPPTAAAPEPPKPQPPKPAPPPEPPAPAVRVDQYGDPLPPGMICRIGSTRFRSGGAGAVAFSADGSAVLAADQNGVRSWDVRTGRPLPPRKTELAGKHIAFTPYGDLFGDFWFWNLSWPQPRSLSVPKQGGDPARLVAVNSDGTRGVVASWNRSELWDLTTDRSIKELTARPPRDVRPDPPYRDEALFSRDGRTLVVYTGAGLSVRRTDTGEQTLFVPLRYHQGAFAISGDAAFAATSNYDFGARDERPAAIDVWNLTTGERLRTVAVEHDRVWALAFSPDATVLVSTVSLSTGSRSRIISGWDVRTGNVVFQNRSRKYEPAGPIAFSPDGKLIAVIGHGGVELIDAGTGATREPVPGWIEQIEHARLSADGRRVITTRVLGDNLSPHTTAGLQVWDVDTGHRLDQLDEPFPPAIELSARGTVLVGRRPDQATEVWDVPTRTRRPDLLDCPKEKRMLLSPDGNWLTAGVGESNQPITRLRTWDTRTGREVVAVPGKQFNWPSRVTPHRITFGPPSGFEAWDIPTGRRLLEVSDTKEFEGGFYWLPDGSELHLISTRAKLWRRWALATGQELPPINYPELFARCDVCCNGTVAFLPDGKRLVVVNGHDGTLWDLANRKLLKSWSGDDSYSWETAVSADGRRVISKGSYSVAVWDLDAIPDVPR
jgi:WD40 repeat protein